MCTVNRNTDANEAKMKCPEDTGMSNTSNDTKKYVPSAEKRMYPLGARLSIIWRITVFAASKHYHQRSKLPRYRKRMKSSPW